MYQELKFLIKIWKSKSTDTKQKSETLLKENKKIIRTLHFTRRPQNKNTNNQKNKIKK